MEFSLQVILAALTWLNLGALQCMAQDDYYYDGPAHYPETYRAPYRRKSYYDYYTVPNYDFQYVVHDEYEKNHYGHGETRQGSDTRGSYFVDLPNGLRQIVDYVADKHGYRANVRYVPSPSSLSHAPARDHYY